MFFVNDNDAYVSLEQICKTIESEFTCIEIRPLNIQKKYTIQVSSSTEKIKDNKIQFKPIKKKWTIS